MAGRPLSEGRTAVWAPRGGSSRERELGTHWARPLACRWASSPSGNPTVVSGRAIGLSPGVLPIGESRLAPRLGVSGICPIGSWLGISPIGARLGRDGCCGDHPGRLRPLAGSVSARPSPLPCLYRGVCPLTRPLDLCFGTLRALCLLTGGLDSRWLLARRPPHRGSAGARRLLRGPPREASASRGLGPGPA